ncbi:MAG: LysM peptidoglycan-binding domain-containing protein [Myxococcota bacterium]
MKPGAQALLLVFAVTACATLPPSEAEPESRASMLQPSSTEVQGVEVESSKDVAFVEDLPFDQAPIAPRSFTARAIFTQTGTISFDIPMVDDERVIYWEDYLSGRGRRWFEIWLSRSTRYVPTFWEALDRKGLPRDLVFLAMVESGFSTSAQSWADAVGPWQFVASTGRAYGLRIDFWVDERRDFERSTEAALDYLERLYERFGDWHLAFAAYNAGPGRVSRAIRRAGVEDFWQLDRWLRKETENYVPKILAAARVAKEAEQRGFENVAYLPPFEFRTLTATQSVSLKSMAELCPEELEVEDLIQLNPSLRTGVTPPGEDWKLRVPKATTASCAQALDAGPGRSAWTHRWHPVQPGDTLEGLAERYRTTTEAILAFSEAEAEDFEKFEEIVIPIPRPHAQAPIRTPRTLPGRSAVYGVPEVRIIRYRVRSGDSLWRIGERFRVSVAELCQWNGLRRNDVLGLGQRLRIEQRPGRRSSSPVPSQVAPPGIHVVQAGESFWLIARRHDTTVKRLLKLNELEPEHVLVPGEQLKLR